MKKQIVFILFLPMIYSLAQASSLTYEQFQERSKLHREDLKIEGLSYIAGGAIGLTTSLVLGITSREVLPKIGYSLIQTLSSAAMAHGGILYFTGDNFTREAEKLASFEQALNSVPIKERSQIMNEATQAAFNRALERQKSVRRIRGVLEITTALSAGTTLAFSQNNSFGSSLTLGFIILITTIGGVSDLIWVQSDAIDNVKVFSYFIEPQTKSAVLAMNIKF